MKGNLWGLFGPAGDHGPRRLAGLLVPALLLASCRAPDNPPIVSQSAPPALTIIDLPAPPVAPSARGSMPADCLAEHPVVLLDHQISLDVASNPASIKGQGIIRFRSMTESRWLVLDAHGLRVSRVQAPGERGFGPAGFWSEGGRFCVQMSRVLRADSELEIAVAWEVPTDQKTPHLSPEQVWAGYDAAAWMPTVLDPAQRATFSLRLTIPKGWRATASGQASGQSSAADGREVFSFALTEPAPPFLYAFAAGHFAEATRQVGGTKLRALGPPGTDLQAALAVTAPMLSFFEDHLGRPFPGTEYREVFVQGDAAQEAASFSLLAASSLDDLRKDPSEDWIFSHELAHQWFAWLIPCADFADFWLNEGFASFLVAAVKEQRWGRSAYEQEVALWRKRSAKVHAENHDAPLSLSPPGQAPRRVREADLPPRGVTYARGALALHRLRIELGDALFWQGLRRYVNDRAGQGARSEDLRVSFEAATHRDLRPFFATWVYASAPDI